MGYRSDVSIVFYSHDTEKLPLASLKLWFDENYPHKDALEDWEAKIETGDDYVLITYQYVKWYPDSAHVVAVDTAYARFIETFDANDSDGLASSEMVEVGEQVDDIQEARSHYCRYRLGVRREISFE
jgi:hypothetical protein